jgi:hypothetical protein
MFDDVIGALEQRIGVGSAAAVYKVPRSDIRVQKLSCRLTSSSTPLLPKPKPRVTMSPRSKKSKVRITITWWGSVLRDAHSLVDLNKIIQGAQTGMLTTRASDGHLHSRAMTPACREVQSIKILSCHLMTPGCIIQPRQVLSLQILSSTSSSSQTTARPNSRKLKMINTSTSTFSIPLLCIGQAFRGLLR